MSEVNEMASKRSKRSETEQDLSPSDLGQVLLAKYGCGPIRFSGTHDALYERHLPFDDIVGTKRCRTARTSSRPPRSRRGMSLSLP